MPKPARSLAKVLIIEDDAVYREALKDLLTLEGFEADAVSSIAGCRHATKSHPYDLLLVDRNLPDGDGLEVLSEHRQHSQAPVVIITGQGQVEDRIAGLNADADYYLVKPVQTQELLAIIHRLTRRETMKASNSWVLDPVEWALSDPSLNQIALTRSEMLLLRFFVNKPGVPQTRSMIIEGMGNNPEIYDYRRLEVCIRRLRTKASKGGMGALPLETVYGLGYVFNSELIETGLQL